MRTERTMFADKDGREIFLGDTVRAPIAAAFREFGVHGDWAEYEITKAPGGYALSYLRSEKGHVLPFGYLCSPMVEFDRDELPDMERIMFAREPICHPSLTLIEDYTTSEDRRSAFSRESARVWPVCICDGAAD